MRHDDAEEGWPPAGSKQRVELKPADGRDRRPQEPHAKLYSKKNEKQFVDGPSPGRRDARDEQREQYHYKQKRELRTPSREPRREGAQQKGMPARGHNEDRAPRDRQDEESRRAARADLVPRPQIAQRKRDGERSKRTPWDFVR